MNRGLRIVLMTIIWITFLVVSGLAYYSSRYFPRGNFYPTGENTCDYCDDCRCEEIYREDTSGLNIPEWVMFFRDGSWELLWIGLLFAGIVISTYKDKEYYDPYEEIKAGNTEVK